MRFHTSNLSPLNLPLRALTSPERPILELNNQNEYASMFYRITYLRELSHGDAGGDADADF